MIYADTIRVSTPEPESLAGSSVNSCFDCVNRCCDWCGGNNIVYCPHFKSDAPSQRNIRPKMRLSELVETLKLLLEHGDCDVSTDNGSLVFDNGCKTRVEIN